VSVLEGGHVAMAAQRVVGLTLRAVVGPVTIRVGNLFGVLLGRTSERV
jgi:hypothetical protein